MTSNYKETIASIRDEIQKEKDRGTTDEEIKEIMTEALGFMEAEFSKKGQSLPSPDEVFEDAIKTALTHPLVKRLGNHAVMNDEGYFITEPWMAQAERTMAMAIIAAPGQVSLNPGQEISGEADEDAKSRIITLMKDSQVYLFTSEIVSKLNSMPIPRHTISPELMPYPLMYWTFEHPMKVSTDPKNENIEELDWILLAEHLQGLAMITDVGNVVYQKGLEFGKVWPDDFEHPEEWRLLLSAFAFLNSPFVESSPVRLPRSPRRELERAAKKNPDMSSDPLTNVVTLRTLSDDDTSYNKDSSMEHDHQWWVSGHIRAQWYPSKKSHKLIWIAPHLKGPSDKPIKEKTYVVKR